MDPYHTGLHGSTIIVQFEKDEFYPSIKQRQFTGINFLSYIGGTLGLFAGFSVLTVFELLIYFLVRFCLNLLKTRSKMFKVHPKKSIPAVKIKKHLKFPSLLKTPLKFGRSYLENSSIHGITHASQKNLSLIERYRA